MKRSGRLWKHFDSDVLHTALNLMWRIVSGPVTLLLVPLFTSAEIQGFWYTFVSLSAMTYFADLGFTTIVTQFVAHEFAFLALEKDGLVRGDRQHLDSAASLLRFVIRWALISGLAVLIFLFGIGLYLFAQKSAPRVWLVPWAVISIGTLVTFWGTILASFVRGAREVARTQRLSLVSRIAQTGVLAVLLIFHTGLYALSVSTLVGGCLLSLMLLRTYRRCLRQLMDLRSERRWGKEVLALLWRYAASYIAGYLNVQLLTPLTFQFRGAVMAGKVGITIAIWNALYNLSTTWFVANVPRVNILVEQGQDNNAIRTIKDLLLLSIITYVASVSAMAGLIYSAPGLSFYLLAKVAGRMLSLRVFLDLILIGFVSLVVNAMALYIRAHKVEPFYLPSIVSGVATALFSYVAIRGLSQDMVFLGFLASTVAFFPWFLEVYRRNRAVWTRVNVDVPEPGSE